MEAVFTQQPWTWVTTVTLFSLVVGSFLNVVIHRLPKMLEAQWSGKESKEKYNLAFPPSTCPKCNTKIKPWHNVPVISWLALGGKCASCSAPISARYPIVEAMTGLLGGVLAWQFGFSAPMIYLLLALYLTMALMWIDIDTYLLPDTLTLPLVWAGLIANYFGWFTSLESALWGAVWGYLSLWSIYWVFKLVTGKEGMGYGDFKLLAALGAWMGWQALPMIILISSLVGAVLGIAAIVVSGRDKAKPIPFGPYLIIAGWIVFFFQQYLQQWLPMMQA